MAAEWAGFETVGQCEFGDYPTKVLEKHWPDVPRWRDVRDVTAESIREKCAEEITLLSGGFPCQPHSLAGERRASSDDRDLWGELARIIGKLSQDGFWVKTYQGYCQVSLDGSLEKFSETWPRWGIASDGEVFEPHGLEPCIDESEYLLLPTLMAAESKGTSRKRYNGSPLAHYNRVAERIRTGLNCPTYLNPNYGEVLMGFPVGWTDLNA